LGRRIRARRRGKGGPVFKGTQFGLADAKYVALDEKQENSVLVGELVDLLDDRARSCVLSKVLFDNGTYCFIPAAEGSKVGQMLEFGVEAGIAIGNVLPLKKVTEGCPIFNIEKRPGDGGSMVKSAGLYALVMSKEKGKVFVKMPSGKMIIVNPECRATIGCISAGGRTDKPMLKAGTNYHAMHAIHHHYPNVRGVAMNAVSHPHGGSQHHVGHSKSVSRNTPPGRKVGAIASSRTGRRKK
jgi:large subunit ribosomal protein L2